MQEAKAVKDVAGVQDSGTGERDKEKFFDSHPAGTGGKVSIKKTGFFLQQVLYYMDSGAFPRLLKRLPGGRAVFSVVSDTPLKN